MLDKLLKHKERILIALMSVILFIAAFAHFIFPQFFMVAMPPYMPYHSEIIFITGILEIVLGLGILFKKSRQISATLLALYFIAILPAHIHVTLNGIEMFGIKSKFLLWLRTAFQSVFIFWAWKIREMKK